MIRPRRPDRRRRPKTSFQPGTPTTELDTQEINGVGQMVIDEKNGFIGLCTGTLITRAPSS